MPKTVAGNFVCGHGLLRAHARDPECLKQRWDGTGTKGEDHGLWGQTAWAQIPALSLIFVELSLLCLSFLICKMELIVGD